jgi:hypothetical protein
MKMIQQKRYAVPLHLATFVMEVKVVVLDLRVVQDVNLLGECCSHWRLISFLVDQVDDKLRSIVPLLSVKMSPESRFLLIKKCRAS